MSGSTIQRARTGSSQMAIYAAGEMASRAVSFLLLPVYTRKLLPEDYGTLQLIMLVFEVVGVLGITRVASGLFRFHALQITNESRNAYVTSAFAIVNASHLLIAGFVFLLADPLAARFLAGAQESGLLRLGAMMFAVQGVVAIPAAHQRLLRNPWGYVRRTLGVQVVQASLNIVFVVSLGYGVRGVLLSGVIGYAVVGSVVTVLMLRRTGLRVTRAAVSELVRFTAPLTVGAAALLIIMAGGRYALKEFASIADVGLYALAVTFGGVMFQLGASPFLQYWEPHRFRLADEPDRNTQFARDFVRLNVVLLTVGTAIGVFVRDYLTIAATSAYWGVATIVPITLCAYVFQAWTSVLDTGLLLAGRTGAVARSNWIGAGVALVGYLFIVPKLGAKGAALALVLAFATRCALIALASHRAYPIAWHWRPVMLLLLGSTFTIGLAYALPAQNVLISLLGHATLLLVFAGFATSRWIIGQSDALRLQRSFRRVVLNPRSLLRSAQ